MVTAASRLCLALSIVFMLTACAQDAKVENPAGPGSGWGLPLAPASFPITFDSGTTPPNTQATGLWHVTSFRSASPPNALYYGDEATLTYDVLDGLGASIANNGTFTFAATIAPTDTTLAFQYWLANECGDGTACGFDELTVEVSTDAGATWSQVGPILPNTTFSGSTTWVGASADVSPYQGTTVLLRFHFDTKDAVNNNYEGAYLDDIDLL